jgi:rhodanese-related sulfurtransferase
MKHAHFVGIALALLAAGMLSGALGAYLVMSTHPQPTQADLIKGFYDTENAVHVSPHSLRKMMNKNDTSYILVDLRSPEEYAQEHIRGAISIPAYRNRDTSYYNVDFIVGEFSKLPKDKDVVVYCYSVPCMTGRKVGKLLADHGIFVKHLNIGWNEWRYDWNAWNHEHEWNTTTVQNYLEGSEVKP